FSFDGNDDFVMVPDSTRWDFGMNDFTIEFWTKLNEVKRSMFIYQKSGGAQGGFEFDLQVSGGGAGTLVFARDPNHASIARSWTPGVGDWHHLAVTRQGGAYRLYVDGAALDADQPDPDPVHDVTGVLEIGGGGYPEAGYGVNGLMDEVS